MKSTKFLDVPIAAVTPEEAVRVVLDASNSKPTTFRLVNAGTLAAASADSVYWNLLRGEGVNFPDGRPLAAVLQWRSSAPLCDQVPGPWLFEACLRQGVSRGTRHFLLGSTEQTLARLNAQITSRFPGAEIVGTYAPPFGIRTEEDFSIQDDLILRAGADVVWVALGTPRQDQEALRILQSTGITTVGVGAAFDFTAGTKKRAPAPVTRLHLEWLHRLLAEPRRLWRRYLFGNAKFLLLVLRHLLSRGR